MNEKIKKLMLEAGYAAPELAGRAQKLIELLVNECYMVAEEYDCNLSGNGGEILKHFGIKNEN